jgi:hypothetical protein
MDSPHPLDYAPALPNRIGFWFRRTYKYMTIAGIIAAAIFWGPGLWKRAQSAYWTYRCANSSAQSDHVIFQTERKSGSNQTEMSPEYIYCDSHNATNAVGIMVYSNHPRVLTGFMFGNVQKPDGSPAFVETAILKPNPIHDPMGIDIAFGLHPLLSSIKSEPETAMSFLSGSESIHLKAPNSIQIEKVFAPQIDPNNSSHFTVDVDYDGNRFTAIDGWINYDRLVVAQRQQPTTKPNPGF